MGIFDGCPHSFHILVPRDEHAGISARAIAATAENHLIKAGISVAESLEELRQVPGFPILVDHINISWESENLVVIASNLALWQLVVLDRKPDMRTLAKTWLAPTEVASASRPQANDVLLDRMQSQLDLFIASSRHANGSPHDE
ncbi:MAG: hypothetical protein ABSH28_20930 [Acidobacteriota bacterium]|jgi:hypothetical protein